MANSVLDALDVRDEVSELKLFVSGYRSGGKFTVLVEGIDDVKVYEKFFSKDKVKVHPTSGCYKMLELVEALDADKLENNFVGIKDADFDILNHVSYSYPNLFLTDTHDLETMMIDEDSVEMIMKECLRYENIVKDNVSLDSRKLLNEALQTLRSLSYIRWYNDVKDCNIDFTTCKIPSMICTDNTLGFDCCFDYLKVNSANSAMAVTKEEIEQFESLHIGDSNMLLLVRGHDLCEVICCMLLKHRYYRSKYKLNSKKVEASLRMIYGKDKFMQTRLYADLRIWFEAHDYNDFLVC